MKIKLKEWAERNYSPAPSIKTLRMWASTGQIHPSPERVGLYLMVDEKAIRMPLPESCAVGNMSSRALQILRAA